MHSAQHGANVNSDNGACMSCRNNGFKLCLSPLKLFGNGYLWFDLLLAMMRHKQPTTPMLYGQAFAGQMLKHFVYLVSVHDTHDLHAPACALTSSRDLWPSRLLVVHSTQMFLEIASLQVASLKVELGVLFCTDQISCLLRSTRLHCLQLEVVLCSM